MKIEKPLLDLVNLIRYAFSRAKWVHKILFGTGSEGKAKTSCGAWMTR
ncbi:MAG: hypothetical protein NTX50_21325 [Candidatus Sumerlaeota bacterium]|nr:hypothetical protein [Candidatus Sumerlaeota bacterium]